MSKTYVLFGYLFYSDDNVYSNHLSCLFYTLLPPKICLTFRSVAATTKPHVLLHSLLSVFLLWDLLVLHSSSFSCTANSIWNANQSLVIIESNPASFCSVCWILIFVYAQAQRLVCSHTPTQLVIRRCSPVCSGRSRIYGNTSKLTPECQLYINPDTSVPAHHHFT